MELGTLCDSGALGMLKMDKGNTNRIQQTRIRRKFRPLLGCKVVSKFKIVSKFNVNSSSDYCKYGAQV